MADRIYLDTLARRQHNYYAVFFLLPNDFIYRFVLQKYEKLNTRAVKFSDRYFHYIALSII